MKLVSSSTLGKRNILTTKTMTFMVSLRAAPSASPSATPGVVSPPLRFRARCCSGYDRERNVTVLTAFTGCHVRDISDLHCDDGCAVRRAFAGACPRTARQEAVG